MSEPAAKPRPAVNLDDFERRLRMGPPARDPADDPLSELARLVGHDDPFKSVFDELARSHPGVKRSNHTATGPGRPELAKQDSPRQDALRMEPPMPARPPQAPVRPAVEYHEAPAPHAEADAGWEAEPARTPLSRAAPHHHAPPDELVLEDDMAEMPVPAIAAQRVWQRKPVIAAALMCGVAAVGLFGVFTVRGGPATEIARAVPTIKAPEGPVKVAVQPTAGSGASSQTPSILDKSTEEKPGQAKIVSSEEQPVDLAQQPKTVRTLRVGGDGKPLPADDASAAASAASAPPLASVPLSEPKKVKTVLVRPDGSVIAAAPQGAAAAPQTPVAAAPGSRPAPTIAQIAAGMTSGQTPSPKIADPSLARPASPPKATARVATPAPRPEPVKPAAEAADSAVPLLQLGSLFAKPASPGQKSTSRPVSTAQNENDGGAVASQQPVQAAAAPAAEDTVQTTSSTGGSFAVQLAAPASEAEARATASRMQKQYAGALGAYRPSVRKATDKEVYRVRVGNLSKAEADSLCGRLKSSGGACFVAKN